MMLTAMGKHSFNSDDKTTAVLELFDKKPFLKGRKTDFINQCIRIAAAQAMAVTREMSDEVFAEAFSLLQGNPPAEPKPKGQRK